MGFLDGPAIEPQRPSQLELESDHRLDRQRQSAAGAPSSGFNPIELLAAVLPLGAAVVPFLGPRGATVSRALSDAAFAGVRVGNFFRQKNEADAKAKQDQAELEQSQARFLAQKENNAAFFAGDEAFRTFALGLGPKATTALANDLRKRLVENRASAAPQRPQIAATPSTAGTPPPPAALGDFPTFSDIQQLNRGPAVAPQAPSAAPANEFSPTPLHLQTPPLSSTATDPNSLQGRIRATRGDVNAVGPEGFITNRPTIRSDAEARRSFREFSDPDSSFASDRQIELDRMERDTLEIRRLREEDAIDREEQAKRTVRRGSAAIQSIRGTPPPEIGSVQAPRVFSPLTDKIIGKTTEGRNVFMAEDGTLSSERSTTFQVQDPDTGVSLWHNYPTIFGGREVSVDEARQIFFKNSGVDPETGKQSQGFASRGEAEAAAQARSDAITVIPEPRIADPGDAAVPQFIDPAPPIVSDSDFPFEPPLGRDAITEREIPVQAAQPIAGDGQQIGVNEPITGVVSDSFPLKPVAQPPPGLESLQGRIQASAARNDLAGQQEEFNAPSLGESLQRQAAREAETEANRIPQLLEALASTGFDVDQFSINPKGGVTTRIKPRRVAEAQRAFFSLIDDAMASGEPFNLRTLQLNAARSVGVSSDELDKDAKLMVFAAISDARRDLKTQQRLIPVERQLRGSALDRAAVEVVASQFGRITVRGFAQEFLDALPSIPEELGRELQSIDAEFAPTPSDLEEAQGLADERRIKESQLESGGRTTGKILAEAGIPPGSEERFPVITVRIRSQKLRNVADDIVEVLDAIQVLDNSTAFKTFFTNFKVIPLAGVFESDSPEDRAVGIIKSFADRSLEISKAFTSGAGSISDEEGLALQRAIATGGSSLFKDERIMRKMLKTAVTTQQAVDPKNAITHINLSQYENLPITQPSQALDPAFSQEIDEFFGPPVGP